MQTAIITLLVVGFLIFLITFLIKPQDGKNENPDSELKQLGFTKEEKQSFIENASIEFVEIAQDKIEDAKDALEKISNEKLMAVGEFSDTVLSEMDKAHKEIMFLYNMLNEKEAEIKNLMKEKTNQAKLSKEEMDSLEEAKVADSKSNTKKESASKSEPAKTRTRKSTTSKTVTEDSSAGTKTKSTAKNTAKKKEEDAVSTETGRENYNEQIIALYQDGVSIVDIAKKLNLGKGEVKLVVDLFSQKK